jgi:hypothetical protein
MSQINIIDYCENSEKYVNKIESQETINYYNSICDAREALKKGESTGERVVTGLLELPFNMIMGLFTPEGLQMLSIIFGVPFVGNIFATNLLRTIGSESAVKIADSAGGLFGVGKYISNVTALTAAIGQAAERTVLETVTIAIIEAVGIVAEFVEGAMDLFLITSVIIDAIDPCGFNNILTGNQLIKLSSEYNKRFADKVISKINVKGQYVDGTPIYSNEYPVVYNVDNLLLSEQVQTYDIKLIEYKVKFFSKLKTNSNGEAINWDVDVDLLTKEHFNNTIENLSAMVTDNNAVIFKIVKSNFFWILSFITLFILFILFLKMKKNN